MGTLRRIRRGLPLTSGGVAVLRVRVDYPPGGGGRPRGLVLSGGGYCCCVGPGEGSTHPGSGGSLPRGGSRGI